MLGYKGLLCLAIGLGTPEIARGQLQTTVHKQIIRTGEPIAVGHQFSNSTGQAMAYSTRPVVGDKQLESSVRIQLRAVNLDRPGVPAYPEVRLNGVTYQLWFVEYFRDDSGAVAGGTYGPMSSRPLGVTTAGWGAEVDLTRGLGPTSGGDVTLYTRDAGSFVLTVDDRVWLAPGIYKITHLFADIDINGYLYTSSTGFLTSQTLINIEPRREPEDEDPPPPTH
jgi:hypothetical protein